jgi:hypothetical protein
MKGICALLISMAKNISVSVGALARDFVSDVEHNRKLCPLPKHSMG